MTPMQRKLYPPNWPEISWSVRERAGWRCETPGCAAEDRSIILRSVVDPFRFLVLRWDGVYCAPDSGMVRMSEMPEEFALAEKDVRIILTVHHKGVTRADGTPGDPHDKMDCREENLAALCQRCHLIADMPLHQENRLRTLGIKKRKALEAQGNVPLLGGHHDELG